MLSNWVESVKYVSNKLHHISHTTKAKGESVYICSEQTHGKVFHCLLSLSTGSLRARFTCICMCVYLAPDLVGQQLIMQSAPGHPVREGELSKPSSKVS